MLSEWLVSGQVLRVFMLFLSAVRAIALVSVCHMHSSDMHIYPQNIQKM